MGVGDNQGGGERKETIESDTYLIVKEDPQLFIKMPNVKIGAITAPSLNSDYHKG